MLNEYNASGKELVKQKLRYKKKKKYAFLSLEKLDRTYTILLYTVHLINNGKGEIRYVKN